MKKTARKYLKAPFRSISAAGLSLIVGFGMSARVSADEAYVKTRLKAMSDYMVEQKAISFEYDATLEVVTSDEQKLALPSSGAVTLNWPDKVRATRSGRFTLSSKREGWRNSEGRPVPAAQRIIFAHMKKNGDSKSWLLFEPAVPFNLGDGR